MAKATSKHSYILQTISEVNSKGFLQDSITRLLMIIIMCFIAGAGIVLANLARARRVWNLRSRSCINRLCRRWSRDVYLGSRLFRWLVDGSIAWRLLLMALSLHGDSMSLDSLGLVILLIGVNQNSWRRLVSFLLSRFLRDICIQELLLMKESFSCGDIILIAG